MCILLAIVQNHKITKKITKPRRGISDPSGQLIPQVKCYSYKNLKLNRDIMVKD